MGEKFQGRLEGLMELNGRCLPQFNPRHCERGRELT